MSATPDISLARFEGPLDLLLDLVRKHEIDITDIPIAEVTRQYLDYLHRAEELDIDLGAEFVYIASLLVHIKSRSLLVQDPEIAGAEEDSRQELTRLLLDHEQIRGAAEFLRQRLELAQATWSNSTEEEFQSFSETDPDMNGSLNLLEILRLAKQALETARAYELLMPRESVTVEEMQRWFEQRIATGFESGSMDEFFAEQASADRRAALFLSVLESAKGGRVCLEQAECFGPITITPVPFNGNGTRVP